MSKPASQRLPKPVDLGEIRARAVKRQKKGGQPFYTREDGRAYWQARRRDDRSTVWTGWATRDELIATLGGLVARGLPDSSRSVAPVRTIGELMDQWMEWTRQRPDLRPKTVDHYEKAARHVTAWLRDVLVIKLDLEAAEEYQRCRAAEGASPRLLNQEFRIFRMAWRWGVKRDRIPARELPHVRVKVDPTVFVVNHHTPRSDEVAEVLDRMGGEWRVAIELLAVTGARVGEICALRRHDLDPGTGLLLLGGHEGARKTGCRSFPLPARLVDLLRDRADGSDLPLLDLQVAHPDECIRARLQRACKAARVRVFTPHGLRRMVVTRLIDGGVDPKTAATLTGHSVVVMLRYYQQATDEGRRAAVALAGLGELRRAGMVIAGPWGGG